MKLCAPSYLFPGTWLENLEALVDRPCVAGVELLFFSYDAEARAILAKERAGIVALSGRFELSLHLPDPLGPGDEELVEATRGFVSLYVLHPPATGAEAWASLVESWRSRHGDDFLLEHTDSRLFAEAEAHLPGLPLCPDTGSLLRAGLSPAGWIGERRGRVREIHLHGLSGAGDHAPLAGDEAWLGELVPLLRGFEGRVELELFSLAGFEASRLALAGALAGVGA